MLTLLLKPLFPFLLFPILLIGHFHSPPANGIPSHRPLLCGRMRSGFFLFRRPIHNERWIQGTIVQGGCLVRARKRRTSVLSFGLPAHTVLQNSPVYPPPLLLFLVFVLSSPPSVVLFEWTLPLLSLPPSDFTLCLCLCSRVCVFLPSNSFTHARSCLPSIPNSLPFASIFLPYIYHTRCLYVAHTPDSSFRHFSPFLSLSLAYTHIASAYIPPFGTYLLYNPLYPHTHLRVFFSASMIDGLFFSPPILPP